MELVRTTGSDYIQRALLGHMRQGCDVVQDCYPADLQKSWSLHFAGSRPSGRAIMAQSLVYTNQVI